MSSDRKRIRFRAVGLGLVMQAGFAVFLLRVPLGRSALLAASLAVDGVLQSAR